MTCALLILRQGCGGEALAIQLHRQLYEAWRGEEDAEVRAFCLGTCQALAAAVGPPHTPIDVAALTSRPTGATPSGKQVRDCQPATLTSARLPRTPPMWARAGSF